MKIKPGIKEILWMATGAVIMIAVMLIAWHYQTEQNPTKQIVLKAKRAELATRMLSTLVSGAEAEKSSVLAVTDQDSQAFADQSSSATAEVERERMEMDTALSNLIAKSAESSEARNVAQFAFGAQTAVLRIHALLAPHIAEERDMKMDELEAQISHEDQHVQKYLGDLAAIQEFKGNSDLETATSDYTKFSEIRTRIIALSHENTNVRSLVISLGQKRKMMFMYQDDLSSLHKAILKELIKGGGYGFVPNPRPLQDWGSTQTNRSGREKCSTSAYVIQRLSIHLQLFSWIPT